MKKEVTGTGANGIRSFIVIFVAEEQLVYCMEGYEESLDGKALEAYFN